MTRKQFIKALKRALFLRVSPEELSDIVTDMTECFEAGTSEGKSEEEIAAELGSPAALAREISEKRKISAPPIIKPAVCILIMLILHFIILKTDAELFVPMIFLPLLFILICEAPKKALYEIKKQQIDFLPIAVSAVLSAGMIFLQYFFRYVLNESTHKFAGISVIIFIITVLLSLIPLFISCIKRKKAVKATISAGIIIFALVTLFRLIMLMAKFPAYENIISRFGITKSLFTLPILSSLFAALYSLSEKNALRIAALYPPLFTIAFCDKLWYFINNVDPTDPNFDFLGTLSFEYYLFGGLICTAAALAVILTIRRNRRTSNG